MGFFSGFQLDITNQKEDLDYYKNKFFAIYKIC